MAISYVNAYGGESSSSVGSLAVNINTDGPASANNLLVATIAIYFGGTTSFGTPTGWTKLYEQSGDSQGYAVLYKIAEGDTNDNTTFTWSPNGRPAISILEYTGNDSNQGTVLDASNEDTSNLATSVTSLPTGSATPTADGVAVAAGGAGKGAGWDNGTVSISGFSNLREDGAPSRSSSFIAGKVFTGTSAQSGTFTTTDTGNPGYASIMVFSEAGGGGGATPFPSPLSLLITGVG